MADMTELTCYVCGNDTWECPEPSPCVPTYSIKCGRCGHLRYFDSAYKIGDDGHVYLASMTNLEKAVLGLETKLAYGRIRLDIAREIRIVLDELKALQEHKSCRCSKEERDQS